MFKQGRHSYLFGPFRLDTTEKMLLRDEAPIALTPKAFEILAVLVRRNGHLVDKDELLKSVWPDSFVEESSLTQNIYVLRKALGEAPDEHRYIETVPRRGYRFVAAVQENRDSIILQPAEGRNGIPDSAKQRRPAWRRQAALIAASVLLAATIAFVYFSYFRSTTPAVAPAHAVESIAVLPFKSLSGRDEDEALGLGMADAIIVRLGNRQRLGVMPTSAVYKYSGQEQDPLATGRELKADVVLTGAVQRDGGRVRVTAQLIRTSDGTSLWTGVFDENFNDIFGVQDSIADQMLAALRLQLTSDSSPAIVARRHSRNPEAYQHYLTGLYFWNKSTKEGFEKAVSHFQKAIDKDPHYAVALGGLADTYSMLAVYKYDRSPPGEIYGKARAAATRALELDETVVEAHTALSKVLAFYDKNYPAAEAALKRAIAIDPNHASARLRYAWLLLVMGRLDEGVAEMAVAQQLDPLSPIANITLSMFYVFAGRHDDAIRFAQRAVELDPDNSNAHLTLGFAYEEKRMLAEAITEYEAATNLERQYGVTFGLESLGHAYAVAGRREEALKILANLAAPSNAGSVNPYNIALIYAALDRKDAAFAWLERAAQMDHLHPAFLRYDPQLQVLRSDPRFRDFIRRHNLTIG